MKRNLIPGWRLAAGAVAALSIAIVLHASDDLRIFKSPPTNPETPPASGIQQNVIASNYVMVRIVQGTDPLENPSGVIKWYGYLDDANPAATPPKPRTRTEPDENTYLKLD